MLLLLVICASLAALAFGVLLAYAICRLMFAAFRHHVQSHAAQNQNMPVSTSVAQTAR